MTVPSRGDPVRQSNVSGHVALRVCLGTSRRRLGGGDVASVTAPSRHLTPTVGLTSTRAGRVTAPDPSL